MLWNPPRHAERIFDRGMMMNAYGQLDKQERDALDTAFDGMLGVLKKNDVPFNGDFRTARAENAVAQGIIDSRIPPQDSKD